MGDQDQNLGLHGYTASPLQTELLPPHTPKLSFDLCLDLIASVCLVSEVLKKNGLLILPVLFFFLLSLQLTLLWLLLKVYHDCILPVMDISVVGGPSMVFDLNIAFDLPNFSLQNNLLKIHRDVWSTSWASSVLYVSCLSVPLNFTVTREWTVVELWVFTKFFFFFFCSF